jgi:hydroxymethylbilane synthase
MDNNKLIIASRESRLAMWQANHIKESLEVNEYQVEILGMTTLGDQILDRPLADIGGKGLFIKELEVALQERRADLAVHSMKDVPMELPDGFGLAAITRREDVRDAFVSNKFKSLAEMPAGSIVGTSSLRRQGQLLRKFPLLKVASLRGNLDTRLAKLDAGEYDAIILAAAGLKRLGLGHRIASEIDPKVIVPAPGQGALGIEILNERQDLVEAVGALTDIETTICVLAERAFSRRLGGNCQLPIGAYAQIGQHQTFTMNGVIVLPDGTDIITANCKGAWKEAEKLGASMADAMLARGGKKMITKILGKSEL